MSDAQNANTPFYCCDYSEQTGEQLFGTATRVETWFLIEYSDAWSADAFADCEIPLTVKQTLTAIADVSPLSRIMLIRQPGRGAANVIFYVALSRGSASRLYRFTLSNYEDLLALDLSGVVSGAPAYDTFVVTEPLFLICTNGRKDIACAAFGRPFAEKMSAAAGDAVWQCTHLGGHRFAATSVVLPEGLFYGRMGAAHAQAFVDDVRRREITLPYWRGRANDTEAAQAAEYFLRMQTGERGFDSYRVESADADGHSWTVKLRSRTTDGSGPAYIVRLAQELSTFGIYKGSADTETVQVPQFRLLDIR